MELVKITVKEDIENVRSFFCQIFPEETENSLLYFEKSITGQHQFQRLEYYLCHENNVIVGITGVYADNNDECWLGWFGIRPEYRQRGYATSILNLQLQQMQSYGYKICRLYTDKVINKNAVNLYLKTGFTEDSWYMDNIITMAKSLDNKTVINKWSGEPLGF